MVNTPDCGSGTRGFDSHIPPHVSITSRKTSFFMPNFSYCSTNHVIIIMIGLASGAIFIRSLTIMLVDKGTLKQFVYLEHGAHWAIGTLAIIMFITTTHEVPEVVTGFLGLIFIVASLVSSILYNRKKQS